VSGLGQSIRSEQHYALMKLVVPLLLQLHRACRSPHNVPKHELEFPKAGAELRAKAAATANLVDTVRSCFSVSAFRMVRGPAHRRPTGPGAQRTVRC
jgi:hypothetical protein